MWINFAGWQKDRIVSLLDKAGINYDLYESQESAYEALRTFTSLTNAAEKNQVEEVHKKLMDQE